MSRPSQDHVVVSYTDLDKNADTGEQAEKKTLDGEVRESENTDNTPVEQKK